MNLLTEYRWAFLIGAEIVFWSAAISFFLLRYAFQLRKASFIVGIVLLLNELFILTLGVIDYYETGEFSQFQIIIVIILLYAVFYGKKDLRKLDLRIQRMIAKWRGEALPVIEEPVELTGWAHTKQELLHWGPHFIVFAGVHIVFFFLYGLVPLENISSWDADIFLNETANRVSKVWRLVFGVDTLITLSYVIFPKKKKNEMFSR
ncbi:hypothetical protein SAMN04488168_11344 [Bacillus sp. 491mf]|uniref:hypothetical protein n=1 Tax=Bacillus TaxID=1386 RepID=UPI00054F0A56|nr:MULTISPECIES: hypothetical protein [unclassified Bacillus (in: firmicutes)]SFC96503.1 hypothetical protein SAMN04488168_11344 [Bacillus sp. 491mf]